MPAATIERRATQGAILSPMLADTTSGTHVQPQPVPQEDAEVLIGHGLGPLVFKKHRRFQKPSRTRPPRRTNVNTVVLRQALQQDFFPVFPQLSGPKRLQLAPRLVEKADPINRLQRAAGIIDQLALGLHKLLG